MEQRKSTRAEMLRAMAELNTDDYEDELYSGFEGGAKRSSSSRKENNRTNSAVTIYLPLQQMSAS